MIAVVTGGSGFIGQNLVRRLLQDGHTVRCLTRPFGGAAPAGASAWPVEYDDLDSLRRCGAFDGADAVFHLAGVTEAAGRALYDAGNVTPTHNLLRALAERRIRARFVYVSSQAAAGPARARDAAVVESDDPGPVEAYGRSKLEAERIVATFVGRVPTTIVRPCTVFGPGDRAFLTLFRLAKRGLLIYPGVEKHWLSVLHVDDVSGALVSAAQSGATVDRTFFITSEQPVTWRTIGEHIAAAAGREARHVNVPWPFVWSACVAGEVAGRLTGFTSLMNLSKAELARHAYWVCSASLARETFGFRAARSLPDALRDTYLWYEGHGWLRGTAVPAAAS